ncbi:SDH family Clp fold serine proteinase [Sciscionella sediminilitoris]|uniref:SDH family Clp fold serine proteinase n=1 Tax=Sciscionella sediminilitoris TaxID=1445613 RepID=UPI001E38BC6D|nr:hypothetical protein [Sciscionella sp. SE31]
MIDEITLESVTYFAELLHDVEESQDLHLMLCSPGGDGETAVRLGRMAQAACRDFTVVVPEDAKSAATIMALAAHRIVMGPSSDLGPIDPQVSVRGRGFVGAKDLVQAVEEALDDVSRRSDTYPLHAALLGGIDSTAVQYARSALARTGEMARQAIEGNPDRTPEQVNELVEQIKSLLIDGPRSHTAVIGAAEAERCGLPVQSLLPHDPYWRQIWAIWTRYFALGPVRVYESGLASQVHRLKE